MRDRREVPDEDLVIAAFRKMEAEAMMDDFDRLPEPMKRVCRETGIAPREMILAFHKFVQPFPAGERPMRIAKVCDIVYAAVERKYADGLNQILEGSESTVPRSSATMRTRF